MGPRPYFLCTLTLPILPLTRHFPVFFTACAILSEKAVQVYLMFLPAFFTLTHETASERVRNLQQPYLHLARIDG